MSVTVLNRHGEMPKTAAKEVFGLKGFYTPQHRSYLSGDIRLSQKVGVCIESREHL
jgi:hypothetical protein